VTPVKEFEEAGNAAMAKLLHRSMKATLAALDKNLKAYYEHKVAEGKHKLSVLNAIKCKLLARVVAVVNKGESYVKKTAA
jgi:transposase